MTTPVPPPTEGKLQKLVEKFGGYACLLLLSLVIWTYQQDRESTEKSLAINAASIKAAERAISRVQDTKVSREEFKGVQEQWLRETQGIRMDIKDNFNILRVDFAQRMEVLSKQQR